MSDTPWQRSSFSTEQNECLELARRQGAVLVRESDDADVVLDTSPRVTHGLLSRIKAGRFG
ncbi:DUF397 domain-containing protein [Streptomyces sp. I05A-00742]|uniref:DUF397 domain-containing protein n=1 Tax=Streptomyces sp. I05A-00742 TaxID=2732853 RepID=UPI00148769A1|nr:DUF397 domain-containing protein [Streptomyces sp. I05A-00742]